jgi:UDP-N-acetylglucosamine 1-carboxyvinyltransferase
MSNGYLVVSHSGKLNGSVELTGAKNAALVIIASLILTDGVSELENVPNLSDVQQMIMLMQDLGAQVEFDIEKGHLKVNTSTIDKIEVKQEIMNKMRASILVMGPLLARFGKAKVAMPGGCLIGARPINYHLTGLKKLGAVIEENGLFLNASLKPYQDLSAYTRVVLEYPSVGATENLLMFATLGKGETVIVNAALEPEVLDLISILTKMGAKIDCSEGQVIHVKAVNKLNPVKHSIIPDRLEAGGLLLAVGMSGGELTITNARADHMDLFLEKLREMGHSVLTGLDNPTNPNPLGITLKATNSPQAVSFITVPYPGFPTDLQAPTMAALCLANGTSVIEETVFENRLMHVPQLQKMGAQITVDGRKATVRGVEALYGCEVIATDIRASCALVLAGLNATGQTRITGLHHWKRGYASLESKLRSLGAEIEVVEDFD